MIRRALAAVSMIVMTFLTIALMAALTAAPAFAFQPPTGQNEFVPAKDLPPVDTIPAAPLVVAAYSLIWLAVMFYLWTIWRRLNTVEREMRALAQKHAQR